MHYSNNSVRQTMQILDVDEQYDQYEEQVVTKKPTLPANQTNQPKFFKQAKPAQYQVQQVQESPTFAQSAIFKKQASTNQPNIQKSKEVEKVNRQSYKIELDSQYSLPYQMRESSCSIEKSEEGHQERSILKMMNNEDSRVEQPTPYFVRNQEAQRIKQVSSQDSFSFDGFQFDSSKTQKTLPTMKKSIKTVQHKVHQQEEDYSPKQSKNIAQQQKTNYKNFDKVPVFTKPQESSQTPNKYESYIPPKYVDQKFSQPTLIKTNSMLDEAQKGKRKINILKQLKINQTFGLTENKRWIREMNKPSLQWKNSKNAPLQIKILLNKLAPQACSIIVKSFQNNQPVFEATPFSSRIKNYKYTMIQNQIKKWAKELPTYRSIRGDGNCFYRAFNFSFLQMALTHSSSIHFLKFLSLISNISKVSFKTHPKNTIINSNKQLTSQAMRGFVLQRLLTLYSYRVTLAQQKDSNWEQKIIKLLQQTFNEPPYCFDAFLIIGLKNLIISHLENQQQLQKFEQFKELKEQILKYSFQCELNQYPIKALCQALEVCISLFQQTQNKCEFNHYGRNKNNEKVILYYRGNHYDVLYPQKKVYEDLEKGN